MIRKLILLFKRKKPKEYNFDNVIKSSFYAKELYDKLKIKCHPDKFHNEELQKLATDLSLEVHKNKFNYNKLLELEKKISSVLNN